MNKCRWFQWELFVSCYHCCSLVLGSWDSAVMAGLILLPISSLFLLFCGLLLLNLSRAIRKKLSLWPVSPLLFIMRGFPLHLTHLMPGSVRNESLDQGDSRGSGCTESSELEDGERCRCKWDMHIREHETLVLHFAHSHCCSWQRGSTCPSVIPQPQRFPALSTSEGSVPSSLFIDVPACRHILISCSRPIIWLTSKLGT